MSPWVRNFLVMLLAVVLTSTVMETRRAGTFLPSVRRFSHHRWNWIRWFVPIVIGACIGSIALLVLEGIQ